MKVGRAVGVDVDFTDFDGDGRADLLVASPQLLAPADGGADLADFAVAYPACVGGGPATGGIQVQLGMADGTFKPAYRLWGPPVVAGCASADGGTCPRSGLGQRLAGGFDFNHDGKQDVAALRNGGVDVFLGRAPDDPQLAKLTMVCDPVYTAPTMAFTTSSLAALGDLDADGCDEVGYRYTGGGLAGYAIVFGFDPGGRCGASTQASVLRISGDAETGQLQLGLGVAAARAGKLFADGKDLLAFRAATSKSRTADWALPPDW